MRNGRVLEPTALANMLGAPVAEVLNQVDRLLNLRAGFDPHRDERTFRVMASDFIAWVLMRPLLEHLDQEAPNIRVDVTPTVPGYAELLRRDQVDLLIMPRELDPHLALPSQVLFRERFVCAVAEDHPDVGAQMTLELLSSLPYLAFDVGGMRPPVEDQLDVLGVARNVAMITSSFMLSPFLLRGTRMVMMIHERLARELSASTAIRLLEPPVPLQPIAVAMFWQPQRGGDPGHAWLRDRLAHLATVI